MNFKGFADKKILKWRVNATSSNRGRYIQTALFDCSKVFNIIGAVLLVWI